MPCNSDYMEPTHKERNSLEVIKFLKEIGKEVKYYSENYGRVETLDDDVKLLCESCQKLDISKYSLELQIWWREHQKADKKRLEKELINEKEKKT